MPIKRFVSDQDSPAPVLKRQGSRVRRYAPTLLLLLVIALGATTIYFYKKSTANPTAAAQAEAKSLVEKVGRHIVLPSDETPTVATVSDPEALKDQTFFVDAKKGDKVLIYSSAKKAILYSPELDRVVTIAPLTVDPAKPNPVPAAQTEQSTTPKKK